MSGSTGRDLLVRIVTIIFVIGVLALFYFDYRVYAQSSFEHFLDHLPDHILAVIAIAAGLVAIYFERKLDKEFREQRVEIRKIVESVLTRSIGNWPGHLSEITSLVKDTQVGDQILIFVDFLGYAHLTKHDLFMEYLNELQSARRRGATVKILLHSEEALKVHLDLQFKKEKEKPAEIKDLAQKYQAMYKDLIKTTDLETYHDFVTAVLYVQACFCNSLLDATAVPAVEIASNPAFGRSDPVYYWLVRESDLGRKATGGEGSQDENLDDRNFKSMIFAYSRFTGVGKGYGFKTADSQLMKIFSRDFDRQWADEKTKKIARGSDLVPVAWKEVEEWQRGTNTKAAGSGDGPE